MQTFILDIIPKIQRFSRQLDDLTMLTNQHWVVIDEIDRSKNVYIFRKNNELLVSSDGEVEKGRWEYLGNNSLLIDRSNKSYLFKHGFFDENIPALKIDGRNEYAFLINETKYDGELNSFAKVVDFLNRKYIAPSVQDEIRTRYEVASRSSSEPRLVTEETLADYDKNATAYVGVFALVLILFFLFVYALLVQARSNS